MIWGGWQRTLLSESKSWSTSSLLMNRKTHIAVEETKLHMKITFQDFSWSCQTASHHLFLKLKIIMIEVWSLLTYLTFSSSNESMELNKITGEVRIAGSKFCQKRWHRNNQDFLGEDKIWKRNGAFGRRRNYRDIRNKRIVTCYVRSIGLHCLETPKTLINHLLKPYPNIFSSPTKIFSSYTKIN